MVSSSTETRLSPFALEIAEGLSVPGQKKLSPRWFYDELGSALFETITMLPEYGLTRADERLLRDHASDVALVAHKATQVAELGSGSGRKTRYILKALADRRNGSVIYRPIDVSTSALAFCTKDLADVAVVRPVTADWLEGLKEVTRYRDARRPLLILFLGSSIGNIDRESIPQFLTNMRELLKPGDFFLLGADLMKDVETIRAAYNDPLGVTAAFNLNLLRRINNELGAEFDLACFSHDARWNSEDRRVEMHLICCRDSRVYIKALDAVFTFSAGETIWTESSYKFTLEELDGFAKASGFNPIEKWIDTEWPFAEALWSA
jgi:L-histidine Nalpha-methyltransferase